MKEYFKIIFHLKPNSMTTDNELQTGLDVVSSQMANNGKSKMQFDSVLVFVGFPAKVLFKSKRIKRNYDSLRFCVVPRSVAVLIEA